MVVCARPYDKAASVVLNRLHAQLGAAATRLIAECVWAGPTDEETDSTALQIIDCGPDNLTLCVVTLLLLPRMHQSPDPVGYLHRQRTRTGESPSSLYGRSTPGAWNVGMALVAARMVLDRAYITPRAFSPMTTCRLDNLQSVDLFLGIGRHRWDIPILIKGQHALALCRQVLLEECRAVDIDPAQVSLAVALIDDHGRRQEQHALADSNWEALPQCIKDARCSRIRRMVRQALAHPAALPPRPSHPPCP